MRGDADIRQITTQVESISAILGKVVSESQGNGFAALTARLEESRKRLLEANQNGKELSNAGVGSNDREWRMWAQVLPPIAFEIARETKELAQQVGNLTRGRNGDDDFS